MDITYVGTSGGGSFELYHFLADGNRPVLEILVDRDDKIWICKIGEDMPQVTKGEVHRHLNEELAPVIGVENATEVCLGSIAAYVVPRIATLMARVYCPRVHTVAFDGAKVVEIAKLEHQWTLGEGEAL